MKKSSRIGVAIAGIFIALTLFVIWGLFLMDIEDRYGPFGELYYNVEDGDIILINSSDAGVLKKLGREIYVDQDGCLKHLISYYDQQVEVYHVDVKETSTYSNYEEAVRLVRDEDSQLIFKN
jgi:hypothetical protein